MIERNRGVRSQALHEAAHERRRIGDDLVAMRRHAWRHLLLGGLIGAAALSAPASASAYPETWVSYPAVLAQVRSGPLIRAIINPARSDVEIKFRNLDEWHAYYPPAEQPELQRLLHARRIRVIFVPRHQAHAARPASVHHTLRYLAAGVLAVGALAAGYVLLLRRRRGSARRPGPGEPAAGG